MKTLFILFCTALLSSAVARAKPVDYYAPGMAKMHDAMMRIDPTGDADVDFVRNMIPHHQGAIDMAQQELKHGHDPELRQMAEDIIAAQQAEIKQMNDWLAQHSRK